MSDSSKLETDPEVARRVPQGAGGGRRESAGAPSPAGCLTPSWPSARAGRASRRTTSCACCARPRRARATARSARCCAVSLYSSHLTAWRRQRDAGALKGLAPRKRGPRGPSAEEVEHQALRHELDLTRADLETARRVIEGQGNVSALLEDLLAPKSATETDAATPKR